MKIPSAVLDTNVIFPIEIRDLLFWFAYDELFNPKWSKHIFEEWEIVLQRKGINEKEIKKRINWANLAFPFAMVKNYKSLIDDLELPDEKDRHVLAAAIKSKADFIVTNNLKDFPKAYLAQYGLIVKSADDFLLEIIKSNPEVATNSFKKLVANRKNPNLDKFQVLEALERNGLKNTVNYLQTLI